MSSKGYDEQTYISPRHGMIEVYGQNGYGFYTFTKDAKELIDNGVFRCQLKLSKNPTFTYLEGMTSAKLIRAGFIKG